MPLFGPLPEEARCLCGHLGSLINGRLASQMLGKVPRDMAFVAEWLRGLGGACGWAPAVPLATAPAAATATGARQHQGGSAALSSIGPDPASDV